MRLLNYINESDIETKQLFSDMIEMFISNGDNKKEAHYRKLYKEKFGIEYDSIKEFNPTVSLDKIYKKEDFKRYDDFLKYSEKLFKLRFKTYKGLLKNYNKKIPPEKVVSFHKTLGIDTKFDTPHGTEEAYVTNGHEVIYDKRYLKEKIPLELIIHELGHILDNRLSNISSFSNLFSKNNTSSVYELTPAEIFAEGFLNYVIQSKFLKSGWLDVYKFFNKKVPNLWKKEIKKLITYK